MISAKTPIFLLGIFPRSGTNYLFNLLQLHPDCGNAVPVWEDYFLVHSRQLRGYVDDVATHWMKGRPLQGDTPDDLLRRFGDAIVAFLESQDSQRRVVTKTPRVDNLNDFFTFFPNCPLLILIRDGRSIVESGMKTFGWHFEWAIRQWRAAARTILAFDQKQQAKDSKYLIVRYEDVFQNMREEMSRILQFVNLDASRFDFQQADDLPVRGSSSLRAKEQGDFHWKVEKKDISFDPLTRWKRWNQLRQRRFLWLAGEELQALGYAADSSADRSWIWQVVNRLLDFRWLIYRALRPVLAPLWRSLVSSRRRTWQNQTAQKS